MQTKNTALVYFSATYTTRKVMKTLTEQLAWNITRYDITQSSPEKDVIIGNNDLLVIGAPVYAGRIPAIALKAFNKFKGDNTPAVIVCVYGNRDYDDALLELKDLVENNGFKVISAGAFIAQHSIFPQVGENRPDEKDKEIIKDFSNQTTRLLENATDINSFQEIYIKGNKPYKIPGKIPLQPKGNRRCNKCGICVKLCPVSAISTDRPRKTDKTKCISCGRCITVCPQHARHFGGLLYKFAGKKFVKTNIERKEPSVVYSSLKNSETV